MAAQAALPAATGRGSRLTRQRTLLTADDDGALRWWDTATSTAFLPILIDRATTEALADWSAVFPSWSNEQFAIAGSGGWLLVRSRIARV